MKKVLPDGCYWARASRGGAWEVLQLRAGVARTVYGESWDADETHEWGPRIAQPDEPAPREVDVEALRQLLLRCTDDSRADYEWRESARQGLVREALALLDAEPREAPSLPAGFKRREWQEGWMYTTAGQRHVFVGRDGSITAADCDAATVHAVLCFHFLSSTSDQVGGGS